MQVSSHLTQASANLDACKIITIVGGLSQHKQLRLARSSPDIIVATPGRLWELMELDDELKAIVKAVKVLVIDEADRMLEKGHFRDLEFILAVLRGPRPSETKKELATDSETVPIIRQTLVFSATMLQDPEMAHDRKSKKKQHKSNSSVFGTLD